MSAEVKNKKAVSGVLLLSLIAAIYYFANLQKVIIPGAAFDELQSAFQIDAAGVTRLGAIFLGVYAFSQLIIGLLADRFGGARVIIVGGLLFCAGSLLSSFTGSLTLLYVCRFMTGFGAASIYLSLVKEISRISPQNMPMILGIVTIVGYSGSITGASPFIAGVDKFGYFYMVFAAGVAAFIFYVLYTITALQDRFPMVKKEVKFSISAYWAVCRNRQNCALMIPVGISFGTYFALQSTVGKKFLEDFCALSGNIAGAVMTISMVIAALNGFLVANICRFTGNYRRPFILFSAFGCLGGAAMIFSGVLCCTGVWLPIAGLFIMAFAGNISPIYVALIKESNPDTRFGTAVCVGNCFAYGVSAIAGGCAGKLMDLYAPQIVNGVKIYGRSSYLLVFGVLVIAGVIAALLSLMVKESRGEDISKEFE